MISEQLNVLDEGMLLSLFIEGSHIDVVKVVETTCDGTVARVKSTQLSPGATEVFMYITVGSVFSEIPAVALGSCACSIIFDTDGWRVFRYIEAQKMWFPLLDGPSIEFIPLSSASVRLN